jgi:hypothetical protein
MTKRTRSEFEDSYSVPYEIATNSTLDKIQKFSLKISPQALCPDKASNIFSDYKDDSSMIDDILYNISKVSNVTIYHIISHTKTMVRKITNSKIQTIRSRKIVLQENDIVYLECNEGLVGHYAACKYRNNILYFFESMFQKKGKVVDSPYYSKYSKILKSVFTISKIVCDFPNATNNFSLQLTGGSFYVQNDMIKSNSGMWGVYQYIFGPDNQNHFCYIWALLYIMLDDFGHMIEMIIQNDIVPAFFVKTFIYYVILKFNNNGVKVIKYDRYPTKNYFRTFFQTITSNSPKFSRVYDEREQSFRIFSLDVVDFTNYDNTNIISMCQSFMDVYFNGSVVYDKIICDIPYVRNDKKFTDVRKFIDWLIY